MLKIYIIALAVCLISCNSPKHPNNSRSFLATQGNSDEVIQRDTLEMDSTFVADFEQLLQGEIPQSYTSPPNDSIFDESGKLTQVELGDDRYGASVKKYFYDDKDRLIKKVGYNQVGEVAPYFEYCAIAEYEYNEKGQLVEIRHLGKDSAYVLPCAVPPVIQYKYDALGNGIDTLYLDR